MTTLLDLLRAPHMPHGEGTHHINDRPVAAAQYADAQIDYLSASELVYALSDALEVWWAERTAPRMTNKARHSSVTYESLKAAGWTDAQMIEHGYVEARI